MKCFPILYKVQPSGKVITWKVGVAPHTQFPFYEVIVHTGFLDGAIQEFVTVIKEGKNIGRSNETSIMQQAIKEAQSAWVKARKKGYAESIEAYVPIRAPMAAHTFNENLSKLTWPALCQPKLEGIHCKVVKTGQREVKYYSRSNTEFTTLGYMTPYFRELLAEGEEIGCELYAHDNSPLLPANTHVGDLSRIHFEDIVSLVKNASLAEDREKLIQAHCFDLPAEGVPVQDRLEELSRRLSLLPSVSPIAEVPFYQVDSLEDFYETHEGFKKQGFEGTMYRRLDSLYQWDYRSYDLLKHKDFVDFEFPIEAIREGVGKFAGKAVFTCRADNGLLFDVITRGSAEKKEQYLQNSFFYIGKAMTVRYQRLTKKGVPYLPVGVIRDYEG